MWKPLLPAVVVSLGALAPAQTYATAPANYLAYSGGGTAYNQVFTWCGSAFSKAHGQHGDPSIPRQKMTLTGLDYRTQNANNYGVHQGMGRSWTKVTLVLGHCDCSKMTTSFSGNFLGSGTTVFAAAASLKSYRSGKPTQTWGNAGSFPFAKSFVYNGKDDLLQDWTTENGTLANGYCCGSNYQVDGCAAARSVYFLYGNSTFAPGSRYLPSTPGTAPRCADAAQTASTADAYALLHATIYGDTYSITSLRGKFRVNDARLIDVAPSAAYVAAVTFRGSDAGVVAGAACNKLHLDLSFQLALVFGNTDSSGRSPVFLSNALQTWSNVFAGLEIYGQGAWDDSKSGKFSLTKAVKIVLPNTAGCPQGCAVYEHWNAQGKRFVSTSVQRSLAMNPIERLRKK